MNAYKIMMFILLFNFSISLVTGLSIYSNTHVSSAENFSIISEEGEMGDSFSSQKLIMDLIGWDIVASIITGSIAGVFLAYGLKVPGDSAFVYSTFASFYLIKAQESLYIFWSFGNNAPGSVKLAILAGCAVFTFVMMVALLSFLMQLVKGPWSGMQ